MSPFDLRPAERESCAAGGYQHLAEHAQSCTCPCLMCERLHRQYLEEIGRLDQASVPRFKFVYALGHLRVTDDLADAENESGFYELYRALTRECGVEERSPVATFGWVIDEGQALRVVSAISDPWRGRAEAALGGWAEERGHTLGTIDEEEEPRFGQTQHVTVSGVEGHPDATAIVLDYFGDGSYEVALRQKFWDSPDEGGIRRVRDDQLAEVTVSGTDVQPEVIAIVLEEVGGSRGGSIMNEDQDRDHVRGLTSPKFDRTGTSTLRNWQGYWSRVLAGTQTPNPGDRTGSAPEMIAELTVELDAREAEGYAGPNRDRSWE